MHTTSTINKMACLVTFLGTLFLNHLAEAHSKGGTFVWQIPASVGGEAADTHSLGPGWAHIQTPVVVGAVRRLELELTDVDGNVVYSSVRRRVSTGFSDLTPRLAPGDYTMRVNVSGKSGAGVVVSVEHNFAAAPPPDPSAWIVNFNEPEFSNPITADDLSGVEIDWLEAEAHDPEEGDLTNAVEWYVDGVFQGLGATTLLQLPLGSPTVEVRVEDSDGNVGTDSRQFVVVAPLSLSLETDKPEYSRGESGVITMTVESAGSPLVLTGEDDENAKVDVFPPKGRVFESGPLPTNSNGVVEVVYTFKHLGVHTIHGRATNGDQSANISIDVNVTP